MHVSWSTARRFLRWQMILLVPLATVGCASSEERARAVLSKAESQCGLRPGTFKFMSVNDLYDESAGKRAGKIIVASSQPFERFEPCVNGVAQEGGFDRVERFVTN